ncbi:MAG: hypothetical protein NVS1B4_10890 [Gemmatimonadaceae bacterium]
MRRDDGVVDGERATIAALPPWAVVSGPRRQHIVRVVALLEHWAVAMKLPSAEADAWRAAGIFHDACRDADEAMLRAEVNIPGWEPLMLHGPAAAARLAATGESRSDVLDAVRWHTVGSVSWTRVGRALYMADFLEPGRPFSRRDRDFLAAQVPHDFEGVFRQVVLSRLEWSLREGRRLHQETVAMWNAVR